MGPWVGSLLIPHPPSDISSTCQGHVLLLKVCAPSRCLINARGCDVSGPRRPSSSVCLCLGLQRAGREAMAAVGNAAVPGQACRSRPWVRGRESLPSPPPAVGREALQGPSSPSGGPWRAMGEEPAWAGAGRALAGTPNSQGRFQARAGRPELASFSSGPQ